MFEFSWLSFGFAVINFLVLAGLLWKFLHKPLLRTLEKRRADIEAAKQEAQSETEKALRAKAEYENKLTDADKERDKLLAEARQAAEEAKKKLLEEATANAERNVANLKRACESEQKEALTAIQDRVVDTAVKMAEAILAKVSDSDIDARLNDALVSKLDELATSDKKTELHTSGDGAPPVQIVSARDIPDAGTAAIRERIENIAGKNIEIEFATDNTIIAGARVEFSSMAVDSSLADALSIVRERLASPDPEEVEKEKQQ